MKKQFFIIAVVAMAISAFSSCAKCATCVNPSKTTKYKICDKDEKEAINNTIDSYEAQGWNCKGSSEAI